MASGGGDRSFKLPGRLGFMASTPVRGSRNEYGKRQRIGSSSFPRCENTIDFSKDNYLSCSVCTPDFCLGCTNITSALYNLLQDSRDANFMWTCNSFKFNFPSMNNVQAALSSLDRKIDLRLDSLDNKIDNIIQKKITSQVGSMKEEALKQVSGSVIDNLK